MPDLRSALDAVRGNNTGRLTPAIVVDEWRPEDHPDHPRLEWDDTVAGEAWRREQAHRLIVSVRVKYTGRDERIRDVRAFHAVPATDRAQPNYVPVEDVADDPLVRQIVLRDAERAWRVLRSRYGDLTEFLDLVRRDIEAASA